MATKAEIKRAKEGIKQKLKTGDQVIIITGKDKGEKGYIAAVWPKDQKVTVLKENEENPDQPIPLNAVVKNRKARREGEKSQQLRLPAPIHVSNVMVLDPKTGEAARVGRRLEGDRLARYSKKSGELIDAPKDGKKKKGKGK
ncbi:MAG: 50S ribosomal protein L24 [Fimbriimonadaceae bacterium]